MARDASGLEWLPMAAAGHTYHEMHTHTHHENRSIKRGGGAPIHILGGHPRGGGFFLLPFFAIPVALSFRLCTLSALPERAAESSFETMCRVFVVSKRVVLHAQKAHVHVKLQSNALC